ncbi:MAG TPA: sigma-70 family RNA polymerase sigma factor [Puia sp.]
MNPLPHHEDFLALYNEHKTEGWEHFFTKFHPELSAYAATLIGNTIDNENIASEALIETWPPKIVFGTESALKYYFLHVVRNKSMDYKMKRPLFTGIPANIVTPPSYDEADIARLETKFKEAVDAIKNRKGLSQVVGIEAFLNNKKNRQIGKELGIPPGYAAKIKNRLRDYLKRSVKP